MIRCILRFRLNERSVLGSATVGRPGALGGPVLDRDTGVLGGVATEVCMQGVSYFLL